MFPKIFSKCLLFILVLIFSFDLAAKDPIKLQQAELGESVKIAKDAGLLGADEDFVVQGVKRFDGWFLKANRLVFEPGSQLIFSQEAQNRRNSFFVVAREIVIKDQNSPGLITWERGSSPVVSDNPGQAGTGAHAQNDDLPGGPGNPGQPGQPGHSGKDAPNLTVFVLSPPTSALTIDFKGQDGGKGGKGQKGGDGGNGAKGHPASAALVGCKRGAGNGGDGGSGGSGGIGGVGGRGGTGGSVMLVSLADRLPTITQHFRVLVTGGDGGVGGDGGNGGNGGQGGSGGQEARPNCVGDGSSGNPGAQGPNGPEGPKGIAGLEGDLFVGILTEQQFKDHIFGR